MLIGIHGDNRPLWPESALHKLTLAHPDLVKMMTLNQWEVFRRVKELLPQAEVITRLFWPGRPPQPQEFVDEVSPVVESIMSLGYSVFELLNEPNAPWEGFGPWGAEEFDAWALEAIPRLRSRFPDIHLLWPGLAVNPGYNDLTWWLSCWRSIAACDALAGHGYWQPDWAMTDGQWGLRFLTGWDMYRDKEMWVTEAGCTDPTVSKARRAELYPLYVRRLAELGVRGVAFWLLEGTEEWEREQNAFFDDAMAAVLGSLPRGETKEKRPTVTIGNLKGVVDLRDGLPGQSYPWRQLSQIRYLVVHHSGVPQDSTAAAVASYHRDVLGWPGIGYHFLVHQGGTVEYVGDVMQTRYNVAGRNWEVVGICLTGDFTREPPPLAQREAAAKLLANLQLALGWHIPIVGHKEVALPAFPTRCPGDTWERWRNWLIPPAPAIEEEKGGG
ncbi:MAG: N-acetylmuramoyl-L-alanine amidase [Chloroflexi bacterium]|nr:N-acetylmuramoyl-L-alanine amidase [Chloroflexota bacterium]